MRRGLLLSVLFALSSATSGATPTDGLALTLANRDDVAHHLIIFEEDGYSEHWLRPAETLDNVCRRGCVIKLNDEVEYAFDGSETLVIDRNRLLLEATPAEGKAVAGSP